MSVEKMNREGMTLLEWACAAAVPFTNKAFVSRGTEMRYDETSYVQHSEHGYFSRSKPRRFTRRRDPYTEGLRARDVHKKHRAAWEAGEDPTEWRAHP